MALPTCAKCGSHTFEIQEHSPLNSAFKVLLVNCTICGAVVGARDYYNNGALLLEQNKVLNRIAAALNQLGGLQEK
jgi:hypothetical protein